MLRLSVLGQSLGALALLLLDERLFPLLLGLGALRLRLRAAAFRRGRA
jgi:hypothetical protein